MERDVKKSTLWMIVGIGAVVAMSITLCCVFGAVMSPSSSSSASVAAAEVDLEKLSKEFEKHASGGTADLAGFELAVNDTSKQIYHGTDYVDVELASSGGVVGFVDKDLDDKYTEASDKKVFELNIDEKEKKVVSNDSNNNYYRHRPSSSGFFTGMLIGNMLSNQRSYYPGGYYRAPSSANWRTSGYHSRMRSSSSSSVRSGSRSSTRSGSRSGGFGFGK